MQMCYVLQPVIYKRLTKCQQNAFYVQCTRWSMTIYSKSICAFQKHSKVNKTIDGAFSSWRLVVPDLNWTVLFIYSFIYYSSLFDLHTDIFLSYHGIGYTRRERVHSLSNLLAFLLLMHLFSFPHKRKPFIGPGKVVLMLAFMYNSAAEYRVGSVYE